MTLHVCAPHKSLKRQKKNWSLKLKGERDNSTFIVGNVSPLVSNRQNYQTQNQEETEDRNSTINQQDLIHREYSTQKQHTTLIFQAPMEHSRRQTTSWAIKQTNSLKRIEIIQNVLSDHNGFKVEINNRRQENP